MMWQGRLLPAVAVVVLCGLKSVQSEDSSAPVVESASLGRLTGLVGSVRGGPGAESFLGIPYGRAPVGELRFAHPQPFGYLGDRFDARNYGPRCPQPELRLGANEAGNTARTTTRRHPIAEDCLNLNVFRKQGTRAGDKKAVIVIIHGGGFSFGSPSDVQYNGAPLAAVGDAVVVTIQYRMGMLGFAHFDNLIPGNLGLFDQRLALEWVQDHIDAFGGDPTKVTLVGVSAGSMSVSAHIMTPLNSNAGGRQLFHAAVMDAGVLGPGMMMNADLSRKRMAEIGQQLNCDDGGNQASLLSCLRGADWQKLVELSTDIDGYSPILTFHPSVDGEFLPADVVGDLRDSSHAFLRVPTIIGVAKDEGTMFAAYYLGQPFPQLNQQDENAVVDWLAKLAFGYKYTLNFSDNALRDQVTKTYVEQYPQHAFVAASKFVGDGTFYCPVNAFVKQYARHNRNVHVYRFERSMRDTYIHLYPQVLGAFHLSPYLHFTGAFLGDSHTDPVHADDERFFLDSMKLIAEFARQTESPTPPVFRGVQWPDFSETQELFVINETPSKRKSLVHENNCLAVFPYFENPTKPKSATTTDSSSSRKIEL